VTSPRRHVAAILPHLGLYGGNLRYVELGNALAARGVDFTIATPGGDRPEFLPFRGRTATFDELRADPPELLLASEQNLFRELLAFPAGRRFYYFILEKTAAEAEIARAGRDGKVSLLANSSGMAARLKRKHGVDAVPVVGGVNPSLFRPLRDDERRPRAPGFFRVIANGRFSRRRKGSRLVAGAIHRLARRERDLELVFFDTSTVDHTAGLPEDLSCRARVWLARDVPREELRTLYGACDLFVSAERKAGWSNPTIEAMACGLPVVCTKSGTTDFAIDGETALVVPRTVWHLARAVRRMRRDDALRDRLARAGLEKARSFSWERTADALCAALGITPADAPRTPGASPPPPSVPSPPR
jgi:glycosyltransferase involved in cell wall biosynthesis